MKENEKILVLDDDEKWLSTLENLLEDEYELILTTSPAQARQKVKNDHFALAILDQKLKGQTGLQVLSRLRKEVPDLRAIILTGYPNFRDSRESFHAGALDYISKSEKHLKAKLIESIQLYKKTKAIKVFLSYQHDDQKDVENLYNKLAERGFLPWVDFKSTLRGKWMPQIQKAIKESDYFIACFSSNSLRKKQSVFRDELALALRVQKTLFRGEVFLVPVNLTRCEIPEELERFQYINLFERNGLAKLTAILT